jgi:O-acetyl-ADP-ribose deacetylase (regulator of RNase III)
MTISVVQGDITQQDVDAVVTAADEQLDGGGGVDAAVHSAAGPQLLRAYRALAPCPTGASECPHCGTPAVPILYGYPGIEAMEAAHDGKVVLGGCVLSEEDPALACPACDARWGTHPKLQ